VITSALSMRAARRLAVAGLALGSTAFAAGCGSDDTNVVAGKQLFAEKCGSCHILARAETKGVSGPNLDEAFKRALADGFNRDGVEGVVHRQILNPRIGSAMPAKLVEGGDARDVAAYVAEVAARPGADEGLLATAIESAASDEPAVAENGVLEIPADPGGGLLYVNATAQAPAGPLRIVMPNESSVPHNLVIDGKGETPVVTGEPGEFEATYEAGEFEYYCSVEGHRAAGMEGVLTVE
jgi:mono/diheme cytochrome c family protein